ncbi:DUF5011 domain-containing protein [Enterococcus raffinosus]|uniref:immunoglobulin-like domain-containing protein n=1 Tax=Enterococcus raffinosus TaxID=71452 RepID=UPI001C0F4CEB|nr:immunoglobulin-like domain-containing protein [Enterococcus raffinosus]MBU5362841.1 DUF5011 domain-containing protein [Enterococcus raffinosus]
MKKKYLASLTIASMLLAAFLATQTVAATEGEVSQNQEGIQEMEVAPEIVLPAVAEVTPEEASPSEIPQGNIREPEITVPEIEQPEKTEVVKSPTHDSVTTPLDVNPFPPNVPSETGPAINLIPVQTVVKGSAFDPMAGVSATDKTDGDLTSKVNYIGEVNANLVGVYQLTYSVVNSKGQGASQTAIICSRVATFSI